MKRGMLYGRTIISTCLRIQTYNDGIGDFRCGSALEHLALLAAVNASSIATP